MTWTGWLTAQETFEGPYWPQCDLELHELNVLLTSARAQCEAFAPAAPDGDDTAVPESWRLAQALQARAVWRSGVAGSGDQIGGDGLAVTVFPMDWTVKNLLRPRTAKPVIW